MIIRSLILSFFLSGGGVPLPPPSAGFADAHFNGAALRELLGDREAIGLRFYNVVLPDGRGSAMAVAIRSDGTEIKEGLFANPYKACAMNVQDPLQVIAFSRNEAGSACARMAQGGTASFSASIGNAEVLALLDEPGAMGIRITPVEGNGGLTFRLTAVSVERGEVRAVGAEGGSWRICGDPCPVACGPPSNYINEAVMAR
jgi:hypothetical protein